MSSTDADYTGQRRTLLCITNLKACALVILKQIIRPDWDLNPGPTANVLKYSAHSVKQQGQGLTTTL